jgi:membrane fusion protein (multidrug efflux system)
MSNSAEVIEGPALTPARSAFSLKRLALLGSSAMVAAAALSAGHHWWSTARYYAATDDAYVGGDVTEISPHVSGFVAKVLVSDNQPVHAGQALIEIASSDFDAARDHAAAVVQERQATLASLEAKTALQHSLIDQAKADVTASRETAAFAASDARRYHELALSEAGSVQDAEKASTAERTAQSAVEGAVARYAAAEKQLSVLDASIGEARAAVAQAQAELQTAKLNVGYTEIRSPIDGFVGARSAQVGAYVTTGNHLLSIVPTQGLWVDANFKEDQVGAMRRGQAVEITVDEMSGRHFHGHVVSLAPATGAVFSVIPPQNATGNFTKIVQRLPVRVSIDDSAELAGLLRPGLSTTVSVDTRQQQAAS